MNIKTLKGQTFSVDHSELYIKPFYNGDVIENFSICTNGRNVEIKLGSYSSKEIALHMLKMLSLFRTCPFPVEMLKEVVICTDMYSSALINLKKAKRLGDEVS